MERLSLSTVEFEGDNNAYLFDDGPETVLVDTGYGSEETHSQLARKLGTHGVACADIDRVFLTHWHADHAGLAGEIQRASGAEVFVHSRDAPLVADSDRAWADLRELQTASFRKWGIPKPKQRELSDHMSGGRTDTESPTVTEFEDEEEFRVNGQTLRVKHAPGHAAGLCLFERERDGLRDVLSGDALLPVYTPNVGGADLRVDHPLSNYLRTLQDVVEASYDRAWPGHRAPISDPAERAREIIEHHEKRAWRVLDALRRRGPCDVWTVSDDLFGELTGIHIVHGPGEAYAHLEHLERHGAVTRTEGMYDIVADVENAIDVADSMDRTPEKRWSLEF